MQHSTKFKKYKRVYSEEISLSPIFMYLFILIDYAVRVVPPLPLCSCPWVIHISSLATPNPILAVNIPLPLL